MTEKKEPNNQMGQMSQLGHIEHLGEKIDLKERDLVILDLECTGLNVYKERIVEISMIKWSNKAGDSEVKPHESFQYKGEKIIFTSLINPGIEIPKEAVEVHHITDEMVKNEKIFPLVAKDILEFIKNCDLGGHNIIKFDGPLLANEFKRCNIDFDLSKYNLIDTLTLFRKFEPHTLSKALEFYCNERQEVQHRSLADAEATSKVWFAQKKKYENLLPSGSNQQEKIAQLCAENSTYGGKNSGSNSNKISETEKIWGRHIEPKKDSVNQFVVTFGKHKNKLLKEVVKKERSYVEFMMKIEKNKRALDVIKNHLSGLPSIKKEEKE